MQPFTVGWIVGGVCLLIIVSTRLTRTHLEFPLGVMSEQWLAEYRARTADSGHR